MEPNHNNYAPPTELPQPQEKAERSSVQVGAAAPEARGAQMSSSPQAAPVDPQITLPVQTSPLPVDDGSKTSQSNNPHTAALMADDTDLIEKEWVTKAKAIVAQTKDDPYNQNRAMNGVKADYLKKRYNKDLKVSEN